MSDDGNHIVASTYPNNVYTSADFGVTWAEAKFIQPAGVTWTATASILGVAISGDGTRAVVCVAPIKDSSYSSPAGVWVSSDGGANFALSSAPAGLHWMGVAISRNGMSIAAISGVSTDYDAPAVKASAGFVHTSSDGGVTWLRRQANGSMPVMRWAGGAMSSDGATMHAIPSDGDCFFSSTDGGSSWVQKLIPQWSENHAFVASADGTKLAMTSNANLYISASSGAAGSWVKSVISPKMAAWTSIAASSDFTHLVAVSNYGSGSSQDVYVSGDSGVSWRNS